MSIAPLLLSTITSSSKHDAVVVWDPIAGNCVATLSGDVASKSTLTMAKSVIFAAISKKPVLQVWSFQSNSSFKRLTTKGVVNALAFTRKGEFMYLAIEKSIYVYQVCSGCLLVVLEASHMAPIGTLVVSQGQIGLQIPLLLSADTSGVLACWPALNFSGDLFTSGSCGDTNMDAPITGYKPLWYVVQASRSLPQCDFVAEGRIVACAGTEGIKFFDSESGRSLYNVLGQSHPILSMCALCHDDRFIFAGTDNGILHSVWMRDIEDFKSYDISFRRCFAESELSASDKAISCLSASPIESDIRLLAVGSCVGLVEVLRLDAGLVRLQRFSINQMGQPASSSAPRMTNLLMIQRPDWLINSTDIHSKSGEEQSDVFTSVRPIKREMGWQVDDILFLKLPNLQKGRMSDPLVKDIYQDDFLQYIDREVGSRTAPIDAPLKGSLDNTNVSGKIEALKNEMEALEKRNGDLMRILIAKKLHY